MRVQLALNVRELDEAITYYSRLFDTQPHKIREGYANFAIDNPPLKLVLIEKPHADERINHLGVEVGEHENLPTIIKRLDEAGLTDRKEEQTMCCFATQNKAWSIEPQGLQWEWYTVTDDNPEIVTNAEGSVCCALNTSSSTCC